ncbi:hypothetical protein Bca52824_066897 [Brassica carinata]|uniref:Uncharacterized protein n=1 Tax=Brassica carinata TaxID=52824 RepID=A0A8X7UB75_BRACI|nr:hypothetical protein Bca52824_066897 [Brassica carinata]
MKPSQDSLDDWRDYFRRGDSDIFGIINHAIILAAADFPDEFKSRRDGIAQLLFSRNASRRCIGCGREDNNETVGGSGDRDDSGGVGGDEGDEKKVNDNEIVVDEVVRIRDILLSKDDESNSVLFHSLRKLESMSLSVDLLKVCFWTLKLERLLMACGDMVLIRFGNLQRLSSRMSSIFLL